MKCAVPAASFSAALHLASRAVSPRSTLPALSNVLLEAGEGRLKVTGTNLDLTMSASVEADVPTEGRATAPARLLSDFVGSLPDAPCSIELKDASQVIELRCDVHRSRLHGIDPVEYPPLPVRDKPSAVSVEAPALETAVEQVILAASGDEASPVLTGVLLEVGEGGVTLVATDRHRLARRRVAAQVAEDGLWEGGVIVPARHLGELGRALNPSRPSVEVAVSEGRNQVFFTAGDVEMSSRLIEGRYPNYAGVIPADSSTTVRLSTAVLLRTARTAAVLARDIGNPLRLEIAEKSVVLHAQTAEVGEDEAPLSAVVEGEGMRIAINARYLLEVLGVIDTEQVELCLNGPLQPAVLRPVSGDDYLCIIMPVRVP